MKPTIVKNVTITSKLQLINQRICNLLEIYAPKLVLRVIKYLFYHSGQLQAKGSVRMKIKCVRFPCEQCGVTSFIQVFYNRSGAKYARSRHYSGMSNGKPQFEYHQQSLQYIERKLSEVPIVKTEIGQVGQQVRNGGGRGGI